MVGQVYLWLVLLVFLERLRNSFALCFRLLIVDVVSSLEVLVLALLVLTFVPWDSFLPFQVFESRRFLFFFDHIVIGFLGVLITPLLGFSVVFLNSKPHNGIIQLQLLTLVLWVVLEISSRKWVFRHNSSNLKSFT